MPYQKLDDLEGEILELWADGKGRFSTIAELARHIISEYGDFGRPEDSVRRSVSKIIIKSNKVTNEHIEQYTPKILTVDIETAPMKAHIWGIWKQNIPFSQLEAGWFMICWSAKWLNNDKVYSGVLTSKEAKKQDDKRICQDLWKMLDEAEIVIAHNGGRFDIPRINTRFITHGLSRPSTYKLIDTLTVARKQFSFTSNRLDDLAKHFKLAGKIKTDFGLWEGSVNGNEESLGKMSLYCDQDVRLLENVYLKLLPWIPNHPNIGLYFDTTEHICPNCGSTDLTEGKPYYTTVGRYQTFRCKCGAISRVKKSDYDNSKLLRSV